MCRDPAKAALPNVLLMQRIPPASSIVAYFDFVFKVGATHFAHGCINCIMLPLSRNDKHLGMSQ
jgi:hypothetical protein